MGGTLEKEMTQEASIIAMREIHNMYAEAPNLLMNKCARVVVMGSAGTGKTSLVNAVFCDSVGVVGHAVPTTPGIRIYRPTPTCPIWIYDTKGFEPLGSNTVIFKDLKKLKEECDAKANQHLRDSPNYHAELLHVVWWVTAERLEPSLLQVVHQSVGNEMPIFIVVNKCDKKHDEVDELLARVRNLCPWAFAIIPVVATAKNGTLRKVCEACSGGNTMCSEEDMAYVCRNQACSKFGKEQVLRENYGVEGLLQQTIGFVPGSWSSPAQG